LIIVGFCLFVALIELYSVLVFIGGKANPVLVNRVTEGKADLILLARLGAPWYWFSRRSAAVLSGTARSQGRLWWDGTARFTGRVLVGFSVQKDFRGFMNFQKRIRFDGIRKIRSTVFSVCFACQGFVCFSVFVGFSVFRRVRQPQLAMIAEYPQGQYSRFARLI
jgi:hypothetical protein